jgi:23S rRNA (cytosine1962-C5)-methyltransferase
MGLAESIQAAWRARDDLHAQPDLDVYRIFHGFSEGLGGLEIDRYGEMAVIRYPARALPIIEEVIESLRGLHDFRAIVTKPRHGDARLAFGNLDSEVDVVEAGLRYRVRPLARGNPGLFLDARPVRQWIRENSSGRRLLNWFAFTGSLGVAARAGGALGVTHVDSVKSALERCRANHRLNNQSVDDRDFVRANVYQHMRRASLKRKRFDAIVVDPPPIKGVATTTDRTPGGRGVETLAPKAASMLEPDGWMLCFFHHTDATREDLEQQVITNAEVPLEVRWRGTSGSDFPESDPSRKLRLTAFARK